MVDRKMPELRCIVSTCGTSLLTNNVPQDFRKFLNDKANAQREDLTLEELRKIDEHLEKRKKELFEANPEAIRKISAETNGFMGIYDGNLSQGSRNEHIFIHSDTYLGEIIAQVFREWAQHKGLSAYLVPAERLNTKSLEDFYEGMNNLSKWCFDTLSDYRRKGWQITFNLVGGFKSLQGFMQTLGMFYADESIYIFEAESQLLRIPRLPIGLDTEVQKLMRENMSLFRRLSWSSMNVEECKVIPETLLYFLGNECELSPWGKALWNEFRKDIYEEEIWPSPSKSILFSQNFEKSAAKLTEKKYRFCVNERLDDLARYLDPQGRKDKLQRLDFKKLKGDPKPPSTHELDAWSIDDAWRIFGHFEEEVFVLDELGPGLH